jgi:hypothetical protein
LVDTGSSTLWIPSINCYECASSGAKHLFNSSESTTFKASERSKKFFNGKEIFLNYDIG